MRKLLTSLFLALTFLTVSMGSDISCDVRDNGGGGNNGDDCEAFCFED
jgi:hypothetical protein